MKHNYLMVSLLGAALLFFGKASYMEVKAELAQYLLNRAWQKSVYDGGVHAPWPWADTTPIAKLSFPSQDKQFIVLTGASGRNLAFAPAHISASVPPGELGLSVIGGHRDTHFRMLSKIEIGDELILENMKSEKKVFRIHHISIADIRESEIRMDSENATLALVTCYPFEGMQRDSPLRYVVVATVDDT